VKVTTKGVLSGVSFVVGVVGLVLSVYFYQAQKRFKALAFVVDPNRVLLISPERLPSSQLAVLDQDGKKITRDVSSIELYVWNSGTETIRGEDVVLPIAVPIPQELRLLSAQATAVTRPDVTQTSIAVQRSTDGDTITVGFVF
jgi:hypothetical protein